MLDVFVLAPVKYTENRYYLQKCLCLAGLSEGYLELFYGEYRTSTKKFL